MHNTPHSEETKLKISLKHKGKHFSSSTEFKKGCSVWLGKKRPNISGKNHYRYTNGLKLNQSWYRSVHNWIVRQKGKASKCENNSDHKSTRYHWANISLEYKRELSDWRQLCPSCNLLERTGRRVSP